MSKRVVVDLTDDDDGVVPAPPAKESRVEWRDAMQPVPHQEREESARAERYRDYARQTHTAEMSRVRQAAKGPAVPPGPAASSRRRMIEVMDDDEQHEAYTSIALGVQEREAARRARAQLLPSHRPHAIAEEPERKVAIVQSLQQQRARMLDADMPALEPDADAPGPDQGDESDGTIADEPNSAAAAAAAREPRRPAIAASHEYYGEDGDTDDPDGDAIRAQLPRRRATIVNLARERNNHARMIMFNDMRVGVIRNREKRAARLAAGLPKVHQPKVGPVRFGRRYE